MSVGQTFKPTEGYLLKINAGHLEAFKVFLGCKTIEMQTSKSLPGGVDRSAFFGGSAGASPPNQGSMANESSINQKDHEPKKKKSVWQCYKGLIIVLIVLFVLFIVVVVFMIVRRKKSGPALPPGVKMTKSHAEDFSDKLQQFKDASDEIRKEEADLPHSTPLVN